MKSNVQQETEAVLLNSQGEPNDEVFEALCGVIRFARNERDADDSEIRAALEAALQAPQSKGPC